MNNSGTGRVILLLTGAVFLSACEEGSKPGFFDKPLFEKKESGAAEGDPVVVQANATTLIEHDVEAPEVFQKSEAGLWDGRPSLGGVWVAHPDVTDPERVIIRNEANGKFVIGALFRRERDNPGPSIQVSSDAASALQMLAGAPSELNITALRREEIPVAPEVTAPALDTAEVIEEKTLDPVAAVAASAITAAEIEAGTKPKPTPKPAATVAAAAPPVVKPAAPLPTKSTLKKPYLQIGIFSVEANAKRAVKMLRKAGVVSSVKKSSTKGKSFWRVIVGPAVTSQEQAGVLAKIKGVGFADAYAVTN